MPHANLSREEVAQSGKEVYQNCLRAKVETPDNIGKIIAIDLNTGDYEIDQDLIVACDQLKARHPDAITWIERVGYDAVYAIGGTLVMRPTIEAEPAWMKFVGIFQDDADFAVIVDELRTERESNDESEIDPAYYLGV